MQTGFQGKQAQNAQNSSQTATKTHEVFVPVKLDAANLAATELIIPKGLGDETFVMTISGKAGTLFSGTFHHPIGYTDLESGTWVMSPTGDITSLLNRAEHPAEEKIGKQLHKLRDSILEANDLLKVDAKGKILIPHGQAWEEKESIWSTAEAMFKKEKESHHAQHELEQKGKPKAAKYRGFPGKLEDFLPDWVKVYLTSCNALVKQDGSVGVLRKQLTADYNTMGGPLGDRPQKCFLPGGTQQKAIDKLVALAMESVVMPPSPAKDEEAIEILKATLKKLISRTKAADKAVVVEEKSGQT